MLNRCPDCKAVQRKASQGPYAEIRELQQLGLLWTLHCLIQQRRSIPITYHMLRRGPLNKLDQNEHRCLTTKHSSIWSLCHFSQEQTGTGSLLDPCHGCGIASQPVSWRSLQTLDVGRTIGDSLSLSYVSLDLVCTILPNIPRTRLGLQSSYKHATAAHI